MVAMYQHNYYNYGFRIVQEGLYIFSWHFSCSDFLIMDSVAMGTRHGSSIKYHYPNHIAVGLYNRHKILP